MGRVVTPAGIAISTRFEQLWNTEEPSLVRAAGSVIPVREEQPCRAEPLIVVTVAGIETEVSPEQFWNMLEGISVIDAGIAIDVRA